MINKKPLNILLIGGGGFIGKNLVNEFQNLDLYKINVFDRNKRINNKNITFFEGDIFNVKFLKKSILESNPDIIYYLLSNFSINSNQKYKKYINNSSNILSEIFQILNNKIRFIYLGSSAQFGEPENNLELINESKKFNPLSYYGKLKVFEELKIRELSEKFIVDVIYTRIFNLIGPNEPIRMVGGSFVKQLLDSRLKLKVGNLFPKRDFLDVRDASNALKIIALKGELNSIYHICSGKSISIKFFLDLIIKELGCNPNIEVDNNRLNKNEINNIVGDNRRLCTLGWVKKYSLGKSIKDLVNSYNGIKENE